MTSPDSREIQSPFLLTFLGKKRVLKRTGPERILVLFGFTQQVHILPTYRRYRD
jgi:hypothetical protein